MKIIFSNDPNLISKTKTQTSQSYMLIFIYAQNDTTMNIDIKLTTSTSLSATAAGDLDPTEDPEALLLPDATPDPTAADPELE